MRPVPCSLAEYVDLVDQAILEMRDLALCAEDDMDDEMSDLIPTFNAIEHALCELKGQRITCEPSEDLPFMRLARTYRHVIPFFFMLDAINQAHRNGVAIEHRV